MNLGSGRWRRWAVTLVQHAVCVLPGGRPTDARSPWADAMRRELDYIADDPAALRWALGCVLASYRVRLAHRPRWSAAVVWRQMATCGALMLMIGLALQDNAGGQTAPPRPGVDDTTCDRPDASTEVRSNGAVRVRRSDDNRDAGGLRPDCSDPPASKNPDTARDR